MSNAAAGDPLQPQPPIVMQPQAYRSSASHGSVGPVVGALAVIAVLGAIAVMIGRLCSGRRIAGHGGYNLESWFEAKCATCIDGWVEPAPRPVAPESGRAAEEAPPQENREEEETARR
ncbi:hypothetical protein DM860_015215 [Cuscuta australis]|uniref:Uncharacterized protein n=1 Tax=Cuscuta australis TaxID=267555 RepID=A0A328D054_9ASTE|nr:hypothetical protein DM860_015215 [Cuscuta australis]